MKRNLNIRSKKEDTSKLFINAVSSRVGGGLNDLQNTLPLLDQSLRPKRWQVRTWVTESGWDTLADIDYDMSCVELVSLNSAIARAQWEFLRFPSLVRKHDAALVFQFSNFIFTKMRVPQITVLRSRTFLSSQYAKASGRDAYQALRFCLGRHYSRKTIRNGETVFCISTTQKKDIIRTFGELGEKVKVSHLGVSIPDVGENRKRHWRRLSQAYGERMAGLEGSHRKIVLNISNYYEHKNLKTLLEAIEILAESNRWIVAIITAGIFDCSEHDTEQTRVEKALAKGLLDRGALIDLGPVPKHLVWGLYAVADVFSFPSSLESFGHPLLEAMGMGLPVVASDTMIHREICGEAALFHSVTDASELADRITDLLNDDDACEALRHKGYSRVKRFSWDKHVATLADAIMSDSQSVR